jgi:predicted amidohydrolase
MDIIGLQWNLAWEEKEVNFAQVEALTAAAKPEPGALVVLPEMFATGFSMNVPKIGEVDASGGETAAFASSLARKYSVNVLAGVVTKSPTGRGYNEAVLFEPGGREAARYRKMHSFNLAGEGDFYDAGPGPVLWRGAGLVVAPFICYDLRFPEAFRLAAQAGAELFVVIANWPSSRVEHWRLLLRARAIENQAFVVGVNRCGADPHQRYPGASLVVDPRGTIVAELDENEGVLRARVDQDTVRKCRRDFPFLTDLRSDLFRQ